MPSRRKTGTPLKRIVTFITLFAMILIFSQCDSSKPTESVDKLIFEDSKGNQLLMSDLEGATGTYNWQIKGDKDIPVEASRLHQMARQHGSKGEYEQAITKLKRAYEIAPEWAFPPYDLGYTYLLTQDSPNALKYYTIADELEPKGFFTAKTARWSLEKEIAGEFQDGLYAAYTQIELLDADERKLQIARAIVEKIPEYAPAWKVIAEKSESNEERLAAVEKGLGADPDRTTKEGLLLNKALVKNIQGEGEEAVEILGELILDEASTVGSVELAKLILSAVVKGE